MSYEEIKLEYDKAEDMITAFNAGKQQLEQTNSQMKKIADQLQSGALLGKGGEAFNNAITSNLVPSIDKLAEKFDEMAGDVQAAINFMKEADRRSKSKF